MVPTPNPTGSHDDIDFVPMLPITDRQMDGIALLAANGHDPAILWTAPSPDGAQTWITFEMDCPSQYVDTGEMCMQTYICTMDADGTIMMPGGETIPLPD